MNKVIYVYDDIFLEHETGNHPENKNRLIAINSAIENGGINDSLLRLAPVKAARKDILRIHSEDYLNRAEKVISRGSGFLDSPDTVVSAKSLEAAYYAAGSGLISADKIMKDGFYTAFCAVRPPGHHAERDSSMGFCIFNNIAITARYLQEVHNQEKILILDWDVHHGNATEHSFYSDNTVYYISLHQYPHYPGTGAATDTGSGKGKNYNKNFTMSAGSENEDYLECFARIKSTIKEYKPNFILISSGFDAHRRDPLASINLTSKAYGIFTEIIKSAADSAEGRIISFLEGGYDPQALKESIVFHLEALSL